MRRLYIRIAGGVVLAVIAGWIAVGVFVPRMRGLMEESLAEQMLGAGLRAVGNRLNTSDPAAWPEQLSQAQREISIPLAVVSALTVRDSIEEPPATDRTSVARTVDASSSAIYIPLRGGSHFLVAGPLAAPPVAPLVELSLVFVLVLTVTASAFVGIPLVRRLRSLRDALGELGGGNWATRVDANAEGALSELAETINRMAGQLQQQFQERDALLQAVSHEIGTPLSRMRFRIELLEHEITSPDQRQRLRALSDDLAELDELSTELVSWMETEAAPQPRQPFDIRPVLESLIELECQRTGEPIQASLDMYSPSLDIQADQRQFQRAIENLLRNAVRYASSRVIVAVTETPEAVTIQVRDDGPGIPADQRARVLEPFARIDGPRSGAHRGLGLGLAIVRRIVEAHGGTVRVGEAVEGGAELATTWPRKRSE